MPREPKNLEKYENGDSAALALIALALNNIAGLKPGIVCRWTLNLRLYADKDTISRLGIKIFPSGGTFSNKGRDHQPTPVLHKAHRLNSLGARGE